MRAEHISVRVEHRPSEERRSRGEHFEHGDAQLPPVDGVGVRPAQ